MSTGQHAVGNAGDEREEIVADGDALILLRAIGNVAWALASLTDDYQRRPNSAIPLLILHHLDELARLRIELMTLGAVVSPKPGLAGESTI